VINVFPGGAGTGKDVGERKIGSVEVATMFVSSYLLTELMANKNIDYARTVLYLELRFIPQICFLSFHM
jgi:hypothetical protein